MRFLNIDKNQIPIQMLIVVEGEQYEMTFNYNTTFDFFSVTLVKDGVILVAGEKLVIERPLFSTINNPFLETYFIPMDLAGMESRISFDNFGSAVLLYVFTIRDGVVIDE